ncbi:dienelactone hydrolase [Leptospira gomenensis]|uniref:Dienelactone hydrolase n=1 Tax=Leptospira gomenensis TaxID=2484974 RepID=A0A5F1YEU8_9LEPT|nr:dienelactone hydrolase [Leptospira gomenensis]TGK32608.1 dienelactone hydrolase [Leptospira gomenensis]TGK38338.1 dienelactone hydrolase [Leptospira gomenensis]TGK52152.1 dienelactone hydrolase [Leptospira gomenensis]TGK62994.1 dienelactone hydrolase [Leptospira gomenensis]
MKREIVTKTLAVRVNRVDIKGNLSLPESATLLVILVVGENNEKYLERFDRLGANLNENGIATFVLSELLTGDERRISANRFDESLLADRLIGITRQLRSNPETKELKFAYLGLSNIAERIFRAASSLKGEIESIALIGDGLLPLNIVFSDVSVLNILGALDFRGIETNRIILNRMDTPLKRLYQIPGSPSHFDEPQKWGLVSDAVLRWFADPKRRILEFAE